MVTIYIDGKEIKAKQGANLLKVALDNGFNIPNLCYQKDLTPTGACRLCLVKIEGLRGLITACSTKISAGMKITVFDDELEKHRKATLELLLSDHNDDCINCVKDGACALQDLAFRYNLGRAERRFSSSWQQFRESSDNSSQALDYDATKCIQCQRCVKACGELQGKGVLSMANRGLTTCVIAGQQNWRTSECDGCGQCLQSCPTAAISNKSLVKQRLRAKNIERKVITTCPYCGVGCQLEVAVTGNKIVEVNGADEIPNNTKTCIKGRFGLDFIYHEKRLKKPLIRKNGNLVEVSWNEALDFTAQKFLELKQKHGANAFMGLASARCTNEENFLFQKFMRAVIGTNNVDHCARLCHASTVAGLAASFGSGAMTNTIAELEHAEVILVTGSNTTETHPVIATYIKRAVLFNKAKLLVIEPREIDLVKYATLWLRQENGTDVAWINGLMQVILSEKLHNSEFIQARTENFVELEKMLTKYTPEYVQKITGIAAKQLIAAAKLYGASRKASIVYAMGITQHSHGTDNVKSLANLAMLTGNIGRESTGVNPLRGQNNVQGACDMGALPDVFSGYQKVSDASIREKFEKNWQINLSAEKGITLTEMPDQILSGKIKVLFFMGENPMLSDPNIEHLQTAFKKAEFLVSMDIFPTETTEFADVLFPAASFAEKNGTFTNTERRVLPVNKIFEPLGEAQPDWWIIQELANRLNYKMNYLSNEDILAEINLLTPSYAGITKERVKEKIQWPCPDIKHSGTPYLHKDQFSKGKGSFFAVEYIPSIELPDNEYPFVLSTGRVLYHYHTCTMTRKTEILPQYVKDAYMEVNPEDIEEMGIKSGDTVKVKTRRGEIFIAVKATDKIAKKHVFIPFHFVEAAANILTNDALDPVAKIPEYKVCACKILKK